MGTGWFHCESRGLWIGKRSSEKESGKKLVLVQYETGSVVACDMNVHAMDAGGKMIPDWDGACVRMFPPDDLGAGPRAGPGTGCGREGWEGGVRG